MTEDNLLNRRGVLRVSPDLLIGALHIPEGTRIIGALWNHSLQQLELFVAHEAMPLVEVGCQSTPVQVEITQHVPEAIRGLAQPTYTSRYL